MEQCLYLCSAGSLRLVLIFLERFAGRLCASNGANRYQEKMAAAKGVGNFERPSVKSRSGGG